MKKLRMLLAALLITVFIMPDSPTRAESAETPVSMSIDIVQNSTEAVVGETVTASWTYTAALPIGYYWVHATMYNEDDSTETILYTHDESITSLTFTPTQAGWISLTVTVKGADGRSFSKQAKWTVKTPPPPLPGDANNDGVLNLDDAIAILLHLAGNNTNISLSNADINGDGKVNSNDVLVILQRAAGWN